MKVYHGGYMAVEMPRMIKSKFPKDFGDGFYCTKLEMQAIRWASRYDTAVISIYEYTPDENLKTLVKYPTHQICFCNKKALKTLKFIEFSKLNDYERPRR